MKIYLRTSIFFFLVAVLSAFAERQCNENALYNILKNLKSIIQNVKSSSNVTFGNSNVSMLNYENIVEDLELQIQNCPENVQSQQKLKLQLAFDIVNGTADEIQPTLDKIGDDPLLIEIIGLHYIVDPFTTITFLVNAPLDESLRVSKILISILQNNLNSSEIDIKLEETDFLNQQLVHVEDDSRSESLEKLLKQFIKSDIILQHDNIDKLMKINEELTKEVIQEVIELYTSYEFESYKELVSFPMLLALKCTSNTDIWVKNMNLLFEALKNHDKLYSIQTLFLLKEVEALLGLISDPVLLDIKAQIPDVLKTVYTSYVCAKYDKNRPIHVYLIYKDTQDLHIMKFRPNPEGNHTEIIGSAGDYNFTIVVDVKEWPNNLFNFHGVEQKIGILEEITFSILHNEINDTVIQACTNFNKLLPGGNEESYNLDRIRTLSRNLGLGIRYAFTGSTGSSDENK